MMKETTMKTLEDVINEAHESGEELDPFGILVRVDSLDPQKAGRVGVTLWETHDGAFAIVLDGEAVSYEDGKFRQTEEYEEPGVGIYAKTIFREPHRLEVLYDQRIGVDAEASRLSPEELQEGHSKATVRGAKLVDAARSGFDRLRACGVEVMAGASCPEDLITVADLALVNLSGLKEVVGESWLKASHGDIASAVELKCERLEKDAGDAEAECRELHRKLDEVRQEAELFPLKILVKDDGDSIVVASEQTLCSLGDEVEALYNSVADDLRRGDFEIVSSVGLWLKQ